MPETKEQALKRLQAEGREIKIKKLGKEIATEMLIDYGSKYIVDQIGGFEKTNLDIQGHIDGIIIYAERVATEIINFYEHKDESNK